MSERREMLDALLVQRAIEGLDPEESRLLNQLLIEEPSVDAEWVDRLVGELDAASTDPGDEVLSGDLRSAIMASAPGAGPSVDPGEGRKASTRGVRGTRWGWAGWAVAATVAALSIGRLVGAAPSDPDFAGVAAATDAIVASWAPGGDPTGGDVSGEVVWSADAQQGVMRFRGLAVNEPSDYQYQLWIFDRDRDERYPVDGGVFDMPSGAAEVEVLVRAKLDVSMPTLFAVTVERPGGVVVSSRERIATIAQVSE